MKYPNFKEEAEALFDEIVAIRRDFHQHPEVGFEEIRTAGIVADWLDNLGMEVQRGVGDTGVVGLLEGAKPGPVVMLRFDMDALPIIEENEVEYASKNPGIMHACGHDGHMAMGMGIAKIFTRYQDQIAGTLKFVFQPGEEGRGGAFAMYVDGVLENPKPDVAFAMHLWNPLDLGTVQVTSGPVMASSSTFTITITGRGGHGASPHKAVDPVLTGAHIVAGMQAIVSRSIDPQEPAVVTVGQFSAGTTYNVIPDKAVLKGTVRSYDMDLHRLVYRRILEMAKHMGDAFGCQTKMEAVTIVPTVVNAKAPTAIVRSAALKWVEKDKLLDGRTMAAEDMGLFLEEIPGCYFFIGSSNAEKGLNYPHHHPRFDFDETAMITGIATMAETAAHYVMPQKIV